MSDLRPAPTSALPQRRTTPTLADLAPHYPTPAELASLLPKETYIIEGFLGQGGMGAVYKGIQISLNRPVAVKIMELGIGEKYDYSDRFRREAQAMAVLSHPNIVNVIDFGMAGGRYLYIVMEFIDGSDLHHVIKAGQMTPELALYLVPQICDALAYAHEHGIVHRDIKPANIMLTRDWRVKVADFGLAKRFEANSTLMTRSNLSMGTPDYAAPEQFSAPATVDHRADIYALGVTFYQMLTGELPRGAWQPPSVAAKMDQRLDPIVIKAMMPKREERYQSARELQQSVIGFSQMLAWEYQNKSALDAARQLQAAQPPQQPAPAAQPKLATSQVPRPQKPFGKLAAPHPKASSTPPAPVPAKSKMPIYLGLGAAAVIGLGAFFLSSGSRQTSDASAQTSASTPDQTLASSATKSAPPIKVIDNKPASSPSVSSSTTLDPALQARLHAVPWVKMDLSGKLERAYTDSKGTAEFRNGRLELNGGFPLLVAKSVRDVALRVTLVQEQNRLSLNLRATPKGTHINAFLNQGEKKVSLGTHDTISKVTNPISSPRTLVEQEKIRTFELVGVGDVCGTAFDGRWITAPVPQEVGASGDLFIHGEHALIESIEYKILDGVSAPPAVASAFPPGQWVPVKFTSEDLRASSARLEGDRLIIVDGWRALPGRVPSSRNIAIRARITHPQEYKPVQFWLRTERVDAGSKAMDRIMLSSYVNGDANLSWWNSAEQKSMPLDGIKGNLPMNSPRTAQLTFAAVEDTFIVLRDGRRVLSTRTSTGPQRGVAVLQSSGHGEFRDIEVMILDGIPREQWPDFVREEVNSDGKTAPTVAAQSAIPIPQSTVSLDAPGWKRLDLAKVRREGNSEALPDGAVRLDHGYIWTDTGLAGDVAIRARFRGGDSENQRVLIRDGDSICYMANIPTGGRGNLEPYARGGKNAQKPFKVEFPRPDTTKTFTLELRAQGSTLTVLVDGKQVAQAQDDQLKFGRLGVFADRGIVEGIAYQAGGSGTAVGDDTGWIKMDLANYKPPSPTDASRIEHLPDGRLRLGKGGWVWSPQSFKGDVAVRARFRHESGVAQEQRVMLRDTEGVNYCFTSSGRMMIYPWSASSPVQKRDLAQFAAIKAGVGTSYTLELQATGDLLKALINGVIVGEVSDPTIKEGRVGVLGTDTILESLEYKPLAAPVPHQPGELVWKTEVGGSVNGPASQGADGTVFVATDNQKNLVALNPKDGSIVWKCPLSGEVRNGVAPVVADDGSVLVVVHGTVSGSEGKGVLHCVDGKTGKERWSFAFAEGGPKAHFADSSVAVSADGKVYLTHNAAYCLDLALGKQLWTTPYPNETSNVAPVIAMNGTVIFPAGQTLLAMNPLNGSILWQARLLGACYGDVAIDGGTLFIAGGETPTGSLRAYDGLTGQLRWENELGKRINTSLALDAQGRVFACNLASHVIACESATGTKLWAAHQGTSQPNGFAIGSDGFVYTSFDKDILCLKPDNGDIVWRVPTKDVIWAVPLLLDDGLLISGSRDHYVYAIQTSSKGLADSPWPTMGQNNRRNGRAKGAQVVVLADTPVDKKLREIEAKARAEYDAGPGKVFADATATLRAQYTNALKARAAQSQQGGHLDHMLAFQQEAEAFAVGTITAPPADAPSTPEPLKQLRETFRKTMAGHEATRDKAAAPIYAKWDAALDLLQKDLTKTGEINEALRVKKLRDQIVQTKALTIVSRLGETAGGDSQSRPTTAGSQNRPTPTKAPAPKLARVDDRKIAEWVLSIPGSKVQHHNSNGTFAAEITTAAKLPRDDFKLAKVQLASGANAKESDLLSVAALERLQVLIIDLNGFTCLTPAVIAALAQAPEFRDLKIRGSNLEDADFAPLAGKKMTRFEVDECPKFTGKALAYFTDDPLRELGLKNCPITEDAFEHIAQMKDMDRVALVALKVTPAALARIPAAKLLHLELNTMKHLSGSLGFLTRFERLERVYFGYWDGLSEDDVKVLAQMKSLQKVNAPGMRDETIARLTTIPRLTEIGLTPYYGTGKNLSALAPLKGVRRLELNGATTKITDEGLAALTSLPQLEDLDLNSAPLITDAGLAEVAKLTKLLKLNLKNTKITDAGLEPLKALRKLETLDLTGTPVTEAGAAAIQKAVPKCKVLGP